ncbi:3'-5' exonuclease [Pedobacter sp. BS3]|uniref:3'-5' exonuclease n=1 Tax=Pedobacter sp. BS3 TaxID=2567937 RepID=UPI0011EECB10|nr:3'-5' exonuclease [Pedobacter sp. BS3]TZF84140.1 3'-5' exonuclease [Pedobacter sp. BS3]
MLENLDLQNVLVLDIETVPQYPSFEHVPVQLAELWAQKTVYNRREGETAEEYYHRAGIWAEFGKIVCISVGIFTNTNGQTGLRLKSFAGEDEKIVLQEFSELLRRQPSSLILCAHNGKEFDFPYLCRRMLINCMPIPSQLQIAGKKPWEVNHLDTMELWKFGDYKNYTSLNLLAAIFDIPTPKDDITGADVHAVFWQDKDIDRIKIYCQKDVITTAQLLMKFRCKPLIPDEQIVIVNE